MRTDRLRKGTEPNNMVLWVDDVKITSKAVVAHGSLHDGVVINFGHYNVNDLLVQMLEDYGEDELIKRIKNLD